MPGFMERRRRCQMSYFSTSQGSGDEVQPGSSLHAPRSTAAEVVERRTAQEPPDTSNARVAFNLEGVPAITLSPADRRAAAPHRSTCCVLDHSERPPVAAHALLLEERAAGRVQFDEHCKQCEQWREYEQQKALPATSRARLAARRPPGRSLTSERMAGRRSPRCAAAQRPLHHGYRNPHDLASSSHSGRPRRSSPVRRTEGRSQLVDDIGVQDGDELLVVQRPKQRR